VYVTTDTHHGLAAFSIDNGTETTVSEYSASRAYQVLIYTSPVLSSGPHTLELRVTGTNGTGGGNTVTIDKVVVTNGTGGSGGTKTGDLNGDNAVNIFDLSILLSKYNTSDVTADINHDGTVNIFDLSILLTNFGT